MELINILTKINESIYYACWKGRGNTIVKVNIKDNTLLNKVKDAIKKAEYKARYVLTAENKTHTTTTIEISW